MTYAVVTLMCAVYRCATENAARVAMSPMQIIRNRKALVTTASIIILYTLCWIPYCLYDSIFSLLNRLGLVDLMLEVSKTQAVLYLLTLFNSFLDPFIYAVRMREIQRG